jgi:CheY-like chemotaxis protein
MTDTAHGKTIVLIVEDEPLLRELIAEEFTDAGFEVKTAATGEAAIALLDSTPIVDVLFTDISLPGNLDGWQIALYARTRWPNIHVIYASGYTVDRSAQVADSVYLRKPYLPATVVSEINRRMTREPTA